MSSILDRLPDILARIMEEKGLNNKTESEASKSPSRVHNSPSIRQLSASAKVDLTLCSPSGLELWKTIPKRVSSEKLIWVCLCVCMSDVNATIIISISNNYIYSYIISWIRFLYCNSNIIKCMFLGDTLSHMKYLLPLDWNIPFRTMKSRWSCSVYQRNHFTNFIRCLSRTSIPTTNRSLCREKAEARRLPWRRRK